MPVLPLELFGEIVDDFDPLVHEDRVTLSSLSQSSLALGVLCQKRLFSRVSMSLKTNRSSGGTVLFESRETTCQKFFQLLQQSSRLADYVQGIKLTLKVSIFVTDLEAGGYVASGSPDFALYNILPLLRNLKSFAVEAPGWSLPWSGLEPGVRNFFRNTIVNLEEIDLRPFYGIPTSVLSCCPSLQKLHVSKLHLDSKASVEPQDARARVSYLEIDNFLGTTIPTADDVLSWFDPANASALDLSDLTGLKIITPNSVCLEELVALSLNSLQELDFRLSDWSYGKSKFIYGSDVPVLQSLPCPLDLSSLEEVRNLTIRSIIRHDAFNYSWKFYETDLPFLSASIKSLPRRAKTGRMAVTVVVEVHDVPDELASSIAWPALIDDLFANVPPGSNIRLKLEICNRLRENSPLALKLDDLWGQQVHLREMMKKGLVDVEW